VEYEYNIQSTIRAKQNMNIQFSASLK